MITERRRTAEEMFSYIKGFSVHSVKREQYPQQWLPLAITMIE
jgi:hypothetical protein